MSFTATQIKKDTWILKGAILVSSAWPKAMHVEGLGYIAQAGDEDSIRLVRPTYMSPEEIRDVERIALEWANGKEKKKCKAKK